MIMLDDETEIVLDDELRQSILEKFVPWLIVHYELDELYKDNRMAAIERMLELLKTDKIFDRKDVIIIATEYEKNRNDFLEFLSSVDDVNFERNNEMFLFKAVSIFETMVNEFYSEELKFRYHFSLKKVNDIISRLSAEEKLDWLLQITSGDTYLDEPGWNKIKPFIRARNFFIHYKPQDANEHSRHSKLLTRDSLIEFFKACTDCYDFLNVRKFEGIHEYNQLLSEVTELFKVSPYQNPK
ncbi:hypothetical protein A616_06315 [Brevibacillus brevis X23]|nr:hypothetical protein A616_06315 [Brevibacillus brevis X23]